MKKNKGEKNKRRCHCQEVVRGGFLEKVASEQRPDLARERALQHSGRFPQSRDEETNLREVQWLSLVYKAPKTPLGEGMRF